MDSINIDGLLGSGGPAQSGGDIYSDTEKRNNLPPGILSRIKTNEGSGSKATSPKGAQGVMQLMPSIQKAYGVTDPTDDNQSVDAAGRFVADLYKTYSKKYPDADAAQLEQMVVAHYNGGFRAGKAIGRGQEPPADETKKYMMNYNRQIQNESTNIDDLLGGAQQQSSYDETDRLLKRKPAPKPETTGQVIGRNARVAVNSAVRAVTAGFYNPGWASSDETANSPVGDVVGNIAGTLPYAFIPGGLGAQVAIQGTRGALQTKNEGGSGTDVAISGAANALAPVGGALIGKGLAATGNAIAKGARAAGGVSERGASSLLEGIHPGSRAAAESVMTDAKVVNLYKVANDASQPIAARNAALKELETLMDLQHSYVSPADVLTQSQRTSALRQAASGIGNALMPNAYNMGGGLYNASTRKEDESWAGNFIQGYLATSGVGGLGSLKKEMVKAGLTDLIRMSPTATKTLASLGPKVQGNIVKIGVDFTKAQNEVYKKYGMKPMTSDELAAALHSVDVNDAAKVAKLKNISAEIEQLHNVYGPKLDAVAGSLTPTPKTASRSGTADATRHLSQGLVNRSTSNEPSKKPSSMGYFDPVTGKYYQGK